MEGFAKDTKDEFRKIDVRLSTIEAKFDAAIQTLATKADLMATNADLHKMEATIIKWLIGTAISLSAIAFAAARLIN